MKAKIGDNIIEIDAFAINKNVESKNISINIRTNSLLEDQFQLSGRSIEIDNIIYYNNIELISISYNEDLNQYSIIFQEVMVNDNN